MPGRVIRNQIPLRNGTIAVYASPRVSAALAAVTANMNLYQGVRLSQLLEAVYEQGKKDGARNAIETLEAKVEEAKQLIPHRNPGKPRKKK